MDKQEQFLNNPIKSEITWLIIKYLIIHRHQTDLKQIKLNRIKFYSVQQ